MYSRSIIRLWVIILFFAVAIGCRQNPVMTHVSATPAGPAQVTVVHVTPTATRAKPAQMPTEPAPSATNTATPEPSSTPTPPPSLRLAIPPEWKTQVHTALTRGGYTVQWQVLPAENPGELLAQRNVEAALVSGDAGFSVASRSLALAVPFATDWEGVTLEQARNIQENGHELVTLLPWKDLSAAQRSLTVDSWHVSEPEYPIQETWSISAVPEADKAAAELAAVLQQQEMTGAVKLAAVGDIMLDRELGQAIAGGDTAFPFSFVASILQDADFTIGNVESALGDVGEPAQKSYTFQAPPAAALSLAQAGFDLVSLANNHGMDFGPDALLQGISLLQEQGIATVGAGADNARARQPHVVEVNGLVLAFLGYVNVPVEGRAPYFDTTTWTAGPQSPGLAWAEPAIVTADVQAVRHEVDHVIVIVHSGYEYVPAPSPEQVAVARAAIDAGAALVIGHHAHILQGVEFRGNGVIVYGLGNFAFNITGPPETCILNIWLDDDGVRQLRFIPAAIQSSGQPVPLAEPQASAIRAQIYALSRSLN